MIPEAFVREWKTVSPWKSDVMVEQDLIISRALVAVFSHPLLSKQLAFRGGTALHKLYLSPASRYSEDIDFVQTEPGPIGPVFDAMKEVLSSFLDNPKSKLGPGVIRLTYRMESEGPPVQPMRLKLEINSREHFTVFGIQKRPFAMESRWFKGACEIPIYSIEELLGTKMRALYQRRKGRDLFDLWLGLTQGKAQPDKIAQCFLRYLEAAGLKVSAKEYRLNLEAKLKHPDFLHDTDGLLREGIRFDPPSAYTVVDRELLERI